MFLLCGQRPLLCSNTNGTARFKPTKNGVIITATHKKERLPTMSVKKKLSYVGNKVVPARLRPTKGRNVCLALAGEIKRTRNNDIRVAYTLRHHTTG